MSHAVRLPCDEASIRSGPCAPDAARGDSSAGTWVLAATILGSSLAFIDGTVVSVALPAIARELGAEGADIQWVVEAYALFLSALLLVGGSLGDRYGRRRVYAIGVGLFALASIACGLAPSVPFLVVARAVQGVGGALLVPGSLALISASFEPEKRGKAIGTWSGFSGITAALGPVLGGWLVNHSWRWAFFINIPLAAIVILLLRRVPESRNPNAGKLDFPGAMLVTAGLAGLVYGLIESSRRGWADPGVIVGLAGGAISLAAFLFVESRARAPMLPLSLFRSSTFFGANALTFFLYGALACVFFFLPLVLIQVHHYTPLAAGASMLPFIAILFLLSRWSGGLVARFGARRPLMFGPILAGVGFVLLSLPETGGSYWATFFPGMVVLGLGMAVSIAPLTTSVMNAVGPEEAGIASGVNNAVSRAAGLIAIALLGILLIATFDREMQRRMAALPLPPPVRAEVLAQRSKLAAAAPPASATPSEARQIRESVAGAFVTAFRAVSGASAALAFLAAVCAGLWIERGVRERRGVAAPTDRRVRHAAPGQGISESPRTGKR